MPETHECNTDNCLRMSQQETPPPPPKTPIQHTHKLTHTYTHTHTHTHTHTQHDLYKVIKSWEVKVSCHQWYITGLSSSSDKEFVIVITVTKDVKFSPCLLEILWNGVELWKAEWYNCLTIKVRKKLIYFKTSTALCEHFTTNASTSCDLLK